jgi:ComF family protein
MSINIQEILDDFVSLIYPKCCLSCQISLVKGEEVICTKCILELPRCACHHDADNPLALKFKGRVPLSHALAFLRFRKKSKVQRLLHALKYQGHPEIGEMLGRVYGNELKEAGIATHYDVITSVPLHASRLQQRGYNQSDEWGKGISYSTGIPFIPGVLARRSKTETQTKRTKLGRWDNVKDIFYTAQDQRCLGKKVLLVDDVVTTGATLESCSDALYRGGCEKVGIACIAAVV